MTTTHQIIRRRLAVLDETEDRDSIALLSVPPMQLSDVLADFIPTAEVAGWLTWVGTRDPQSVVLLTELLRQNNEARDQILHRALDRLGVVTVDERTGIQMSVLMRMIELVAARGAA